MPARSDSSSKRIRFSVRSLPSFPLGQPSLTADSSAAFLSRLRAITTDLSAAHFCVTISKP